LEFINQNGPTSDVLAAEGTAPMGITTQRLRIAAQDFARLERLVGVDCNAETLAVRNWDLATSSPSIMFKGLRMKFSSARMELKLQPKLSPAIDE
jgi:hypothetical protein